MIESLSLTETADQNILEESCLDFSSNVQVTTNNTLKAKCLTGYQLKYDYLEENWFPLEQVRAWSEKV